MEIGLKYLLTQCEAYQIQIKPMNKAVVIPVFSFIDKLVTSLKQYIAKPNLSTWAQFIVNNNQNSQIMTNIIGSWEKHKAKSLQCQLLATLLPTQDLQKLNIFMKLRKYTTKVGSKNMLDEILLQHEDVIGIVHHSYSSTQTKKKIINGIKKLFISFKISQAKLYSCVFIEYALSLHEQIQDQQINEAQVSRKKINDNQPYRKEDIADVISKFHSSIHEDNGLYRKIKPSDLKQQESFSIIERKFIPFENSKEKIENRSKSKSYKSKTYQELFYETYKSIESPSPQNNKKPKTPKKLPENQVQKFSSSHLYDSLPKENKNEIKRISTLQQLRRIEENEKSQLHQIQGGYSTWVKMINNNREFKEKMLKNQQQENSRLSKQEKDSISIVHDSIVKRTRNWQ